MKTILQLLVVFFCLVACDSNDTYGDINEPLEFEIPSNFPELTYDLASNPPTKYGFELGKKLFYDGRLSSDGIISCGFCHEQRTAFTHHGHQFSHGINDLEGTRNTPAIQNMAFMKEFSWDGATNQIDFFPIIPINNPVEMGETIPSILKKLRKDPSYVELFQKAFDNGTIDSENFLKAFSQFMLMMISANSKYDRYIRNEEAVVFSDSEKRGLQIFKDKCASCHATDLFSDDSFRNNGLPINPKINDTGRALVSGSEADNYKFKVPSLRNVAITQPYMHDGRFGSLMAVLDFYDNGMKDSPTLDPILKNNSKVGIPLAASEKEDLFAFLNTLTDENYIYDERFSEF